jgi:hypothetical protein
MKKKISLSADQLRALMVDGECSIVGGVYEVSGVEGLYVRFDEGGVLSKVDAPEKRPVGRHKKVKEEGVSAPVGRPRSTRIKSKATSGVFADKVGKFVEGQVIDVESTYPRRVEILRVEVKQAEDISDKEWKEMGCVWTADFVAKNVKALALLDNGLSMKDEVGLYWYKEVSVE